MEIKHDIIYFNNEQVGQLTKNTCSHTVMGDFMDFVERIKSNSEFEDLEEKIEDYEKFITNIKSFIDDKDVMIEDDLTVEEIFEGLEEITEMYL